MPTTFPESHSQRDHHELDALGGLRVPDNDAFKAEAEPLPILRVLDG